eukprot:jgi/Tetstr1/456544/TSEL_043266.t1
METAVPIDFQEAWAEAQRCVNERVVAAVEADDPVVLDRALKWKYLLPQLLLRAPSRGGRRRLQALAWRFRAFAERRMTELLRDKHPSRSHPIPDAAYDIPVDEAALTVDMGVPYQQLKHHVAAGPSGMRNEYLRCLVGEYAPASGPAAVRAMSEVASMYLQGRMPGWFNRLFASARLVAPVKKLGEGRAPDVRHVAVGEAERRVAERAVADNMKGAPLATTSFCVAIHPEVQQCDTTLEVNDGAARFNANDGFLVGIPEHVWPALHAFRASIKASVGLEVRFDKMHAYNADMEAARREAPADIEWPELDGHHGIGS